MNPLFKLSPHINLMLRFVPPQRVATIAEQLARPAIMAQGQLMAKQLQTNQPFKHPVFREETAGLNALSALDQKLIGLSQFTTVQNQQTLTAHLKTLGQEPEFVPFKDPRARQFVQETMVSEIYKNNLTLRRKFRQLDDGQMESMFAKMKDVSLSEQGLFVYPDISQKGTRTTTHILTDLGFNVLMNDPSLRFRMLPTHSLAMAFFETKYNGSYMKLAPYIGDIPDTHFDIMQWVGARPFNIPFEEFQNEIADGHPAPGDEFYKHELYHVDVSSSCGLDVVKPTLKMAQFVENFGKRCPMNVAIFLRAFQNQLRDLENPLFRPELRLAEHLYEGNESGVELFWLSWSSMLIYVASSIGSQDQILFFLNSLEQRGFFQDLLKEVFYNSEWKTLGFDLESLSKSIQRLDNLNSYIQQTNGLSIIPMDSFQLELAFYSRGVYPLQYLRAHLPHAQF